MSSTLGEAARVIGEAEKDLFNNYNPLEPQPEETLAQYMTRDRADRKNHLLSTLKWVLFYEKYRDGWINAKKQSVRKLRTTLKRQIEATNMVMRSEAQDEEIRVASEGHIKNQKEAKKLAEKLFQRAAAERRAAMTPAQEEKRQEGIVWREGKFGKGENRREDRLRKQMRLLAEGDAMAEKDGIGSTAGHKDTGILGYENDTNMLEGLVVNARDDEQNDVENEDGDKDQRMRVPSPTSAGGGDEDQSVGDPDNGSYDSAMMNGFDNQSVDGDQDIEEADDCSEDSDSDDSASMDEPE